MKLTLTILLTIIALMLSGAYLYRVGLRDGEQQYKHSHRMYLALKSAYHFGYMDADAGRQEDWDGDGQ